MIYIDILIIGGDEYHQALIDRCLAKVDYFGLLNFNEFLTILSVNVLLVLLYDHLLFDLFFMGPLDDPQLIAVPLEKDK